jgi:hypothetical protein
MLAISEAGRPHRSKNSTRTAAFERRPAAGFASQPEIKNPPRKPVGPNLSADEPSPKGVGSIFSLEPESNHFCHVRFLWRLAFKRFLRLCLFIFRRRFFFRFPMW